MPPPGTVHILNSPAVTCLFSKLRAKSCGQKAYIYYCDRLMRILVEETLARLPSVAPTTVQTPCGPYEGLEYGVDMEDICAVSIVRSGNTLLETVRSIIPEVAVGHVLVQRDEDDPDKKPIYFYHKLPPDIANRTVLLCDPMLATGGSAKAALRCLLDAGVAEERIVFSNVVACPEGIQAMQVAYPKVTIVTAGQDPGLNEHKFIVPGLGDFGDRYYNTGDFCNSKWRKTSLLELD